MTSRLTLIEQLMQETGLDGDSAPDIAQWKQFQAALNDRLLSNASAIRETEIALKEAQKKRQSRGLHIASMSHELRTPLAAIIGYSNLLLEEAEEEEKVVNFRPFLDKISGSADHLLGLIDDILDLSKIDAGKFEFHEETFSVQAAVDDTLITVAPAVAQNGNRLAVEILSEGTLGLMYADPLRLKQILINLLSNGAKFTQNGEIKLKIGRKSVPVQPPIAMKNMVGWMTFSVEDSGIGMNQAELDTLFQPFQQASAQTAAQFGGTGLGLVISKKFCELMGGHIEVTSEKGVGTKFTVELPIFESDAEERTNSSLFRIRQLEGEQGDGPILLIDDDTMIQAILASYLMRAGLKVECATSGLEGIEMACKLNPSAVILDVYMPKADGWQVLSKLMSDPNLGTIPVILTSADDLKQRGLVQGAADFLQKPIGRKELIAAIKKYVFVPEPSL